jgi:redox-sensitive bicupin YhaK (pirin superfamily)
VQLLSAGRGVRHSEHSAEQGAGATRFVQMWLRPDESGLPPRYARGDVADAGPDRLVPLVSGRADVDAPVRIHTAGAALHVTRLGDGGSVRLPDAPHVHLFVVRGAVDLEGAGRLGEGDAARFTADGSRRLTGRPHPDSSAVTPRGSPAFPQTNRGGAEVLVWELP